MALVPFSYMNIFDFGTKSEEKNKSRIHYFYVDNKKIKIEEHQEKGIGGIFWECVNQNNIKIFFI